MDDERYGSDLQTNSRGSFGCESGGAAEVLRFCGSGLSIRVVAGDAEVELRELQPSELFSPTVQDGTDSARSVASMEGQGSGLLPD